MKKSTGAPETATSAYTQQRELLNSEGWHHRLLASLEIHSTWAASVNGLRTCIDPLGSRLVALARYAAPGERQWGEQAYTDAAGPRRLLTHSAGRPATH